MCLCFIQLRNSAKFRSVVTKVEREMIIHPISSSHLDNHNTLFTCLNQTSLNRLQTVQNAAARLLSRNDKRSHIKLILSVKFCIHFYMLALSFRALHGQSPQYITDHLHLYMPNQAVKSMK